MLNSSKDIYVTFMELLPVVSNIVNETISHGEQIISSSTDLLAVSDNQLMPLDAQSVLNYYNLLLVLLFSTLLKILFPVI